MSSAVGPLVYDSLAAVLFRREITPPPPGPRNGTAGPGPVFLVQWNSNTGHVGIFDGARGGYLRSIMMERLAQVFFFSGPCGISE